MNGTRLGPWAAAVRSFLLVTAFAAMLASMPARSDKGLLAPTFPVMQGFVRMTAPIPALANLALEPRRQHGDAAIPRHQTAIAAPLTYEFRPEVSTEVRRALVARVAQASGADAARKFEGLLSATQPFEIFRKLLAKYDMSLERLADVIAAYVLIGWSLETGSDPPDSQVHAAVEQIRTQLDGDLHLRQWDGAERQRMAEGMIYQSLIFSDWNRQLVESHDNAGLATLKQMVARNAFEIGCDFTKLELTDHGFRRRN